MDKATAAPQSNYTCNKPGIGLYIFINTKNLFAIKGLSPPKQTIPCENKFRPSSGQKVSFKNFHFHQLSQFLS